MEIEMYQNDAITAWPDEETDLAIEDGFLHPDLSPKCDRRVREKQTADAGPMDDALPFGSRLNELELMPPDYYI